MSLFSGSILLATDGSAEAELAVELARSTGSELHLVHVKLLPITPPYPEVLDWRDDFERAEREAQELLDEQVKKVGQPGGAVDRIYLREERPPADEIVALAEELGVGLIVVGSRGRGVIRRALKESPQGERLRSGRPSSALSGPRGRIWSVSSRPRRRRF